MAGRKGEAEATSIAQKYLDLDDAAGGDEEEEEEEEDEVSSEDDDTDSEDDSDDEEQITPANLEEMRLLSRNAASMSNEIKRVDDKVQRRIKLASTEGNRLIVCCLRGNSDLLEIVLQKRDTNVNATLSDGTSALQVAAEMGHATIVERLIIAGSDLDYGSPGKLPAVLAATNGHVEALATIIEAGANLATPLAAVEVGYGPKAVAAVKKQLQASNPVGAALALICLLSPKSAAQDASASNSDTSPSGKPPLAPAAASAAAASPRLRTKIDTARSTDQLYRQMSEEKNASKTSDAAANADAAEAATDPKKIK